MHLPKTDRDAVRTRRSRFLTQLATWGLGGSAMSLSGCGTILHNERVGGPHSRDIDWKIVALDGLGLALFFVPGVIAFAVDFYTGAIYLPPEFPQGPMYPEDQMLPAHQPSGGQAAPLNLPAPPLARERAFHRGATGNLKRVVVPRTELMPRHLERVVSDRMRRRISLIDANTRVSQLRSLDGFAEQCRRHKDDASFGIAARTFYARFGLT